MSCVFVAVGGVSVSVVVVVSPLALSLLCCLWRGRLVVAPPSLSASPSLYKLVLSNCGDFRDANTPSEEFMELLGQGASINGVCTDDRNRTLLHCAAERGYTHMAEWLMKNGADHTARGLYSDSTPAEYSNDHGDGSVARVIEEFVRR